METEFNQLSKSIDQSSNSFGIGGRVEFDATEVYHQGQIKATKGPDSSHCDQCENDVKSKNIMKIHIDWYTLIGTLMALTQATVTP